MKIDYTALSQPVSSYDIAALKKVRANRPGNFMTIVSYAVVGMFVSFLLSQVMYAALSPHPLADFSVLIFLVSLPVIPWASYVIVNRRMNKLAKLYKFAKANSLTLKHDMYARGYPGALFSEGYSLYVKEALLFPDGTEVGNYRYQNERQGGYQDWTFASVKLSRRLPHMVLDAKKNNFFGGLSTLPAGFDKGQTIKLEGDFNNYFTLYAPKKYERDALYVFTPDVMAAVIDAGQAYDMEVVDNSLLLYAKGHIAFDSGRQLAAVLSIIGTISSELHHQTDYYADERVGDRALNMVAKPGRRLESNLSTLGAIVLLVWLIIVLWYVSMPLIKMF